MAWRIPRRVSSACASRRASATGPETAASAASKSGPGLLRTRVIRATCGRARMRAVVTNHSVGDGWLQLDLNSRQLQGLERARARPQEPAPLVRDGLAHCPAPDH